jgi:hypothetical protein
MALRSPARPTTRPALERLAAWIERRPVLVPVVAAGCYLPFVFLGYGTDIDVANLRRAGQTLVEDGTYRPSRPPGSIVYEAAVGVLDRIGGSVAVNLGSLAMALVVLVMLGQLLRGMGSRHSGLLTIFVAANPFFVIAATSVGDYLWALAFLLVGIERFLARRPIVAGGLWALAIGCRASTVVLVAAFLVAELLATRRDRVPVLVAGGMALLGAVVLFVPAWWSVGRDGDFLRAEFDWGGWITHVGRSLVKNVVVVGLFGAVVVLAGLSTLVAAARRWPSETLVRFALIGGALSELLFLRVPWKLSHLLPVLVLGVVLFGASPKMTARFAALLVVSQLVYGVVGIRVLVPDVPNRAQGSRVDVAVVAGPLVNDVRCRLRDRESDGVSLSRSENNWACTLAPWRGPDGLDPLDGNP